MFDDDDDDNDDDDMILVIFCTGDLYLSTKFKFG